MRDFFTFFKDIQDMKLPFFAFSIYHILFLGMAITLIICLYRHYGTLNETGQRKFQVGMAIYFLIEEAIYTLWLLLVCHEDVWLQILPLELCSVCAYMNALTVYVRKDHLRFFSGVVGLIAGSVAMIYPANISGLYPVMSYRTINFYMLHASFILFSLIQLRDKSLLSYRYVKHNYVLLACMFSVAFTVNVMYHTQYMFVGVPPQISFIASLYQLTGILFFLPVILLILFVLQYIVVFILRWLFKYPGIR